MSVASLHLDKALTGTSSDTKPTSIAQGTLFYETDSGAWFVYNGSAWVGYTSSAKQSPVDVNLAAQGLITQNFDRSQGVGAQIMIDGTIYAMLVPLRAGQVVSNIEIAITGAGSGTSTSLAALLDASGARLAISADQGSAWDAGGVKSVAMGTAYTVPTTGGYYVALLAKTATTMPTLLRGGTSSSINVGIGSGSRPYGTQASQTTIGTSVTIGATSGIAFWVGIT